MNVRELKAALAALPAEYDESVVVVNATGIYGSAVVGLSSRRG